MSKAYEVITNRILETLEKGTIPWRKPWRGGSAGAPYSLASRKRYRGINPFMLTMTAMEFGYESPAWLTFNQCKKLGAKVRKGEKGTPVVFWKLHQVVDEKSDDAKLKKVPFLRHYWVFNTDQVDGIPAGKLPAAAPLELFEHDPIQSAMDIFSNMPQLPSMIYGGGRACYRPSNDSVTMPKVQRFEHVEDYYSTLFHELTHSTGHEKRCNRKGINEIAAFGDETYSQEELVAEMGAAFLCGEAGIFHNTADNSAAYVQSWLKALRNDPKMLVIAASQAQKAADFILRRTFDN